MTTNEIVSIENIMKEYIEGIRPPENIRPKLDIGYKSEGQSIFIFKFRPQCNDLKVIKEYPTAKTTYVEIKNNWKVFWN